MEMSDVLTLDDCYRWATSSRDDTHAGYERYAEDYMI